MATRTKKPAPRTVRAPEPPPAPTLDPALLAALAAVTALVARLVEVGTDRPLLAARAAYVAFERVAELVTATPGARLPVPQEHAHFLIGAATRPGDDGGIGTAVRDRLDFIVRYVEVKP